MPRRKTPEPVSERERRRAHPEALAEQIGSIAEMLVRNSTQVTALFENFQRQIADLFAGFGDFAIRLERFLGSLPNFGGVVHHFTEFENCTLRDGIPVIWLPRPNVANLLLEATDRGARVAILLEHESEILDDCEAIASEVTHPELRALADFVMQARRVHATSPAATQALGVVLCEEAINGLLGWREFTPQRRVLGEIDELPLGYFRSVICLWPVSQFYQTWRRPNPIPRETSRHASIHKFLDAYSREHALIAVMLATSLVREWQELGGEDGALAALADELLRGAPGANKSRPR
jgi:hypothetical protein